MKKINLTGAASILSGLSLLASSSIINASILDKVKQYLGNSMKAFEGDVTGKGIILIIVGAALIILAVLLNQFVFKKKKKELEEE